MLAKRLELAKDLALQAGAVLREAYTGPKSVHHKGRIDLLTNFDLESEKIIINGIQNEFPGDEIISEEGSTLDNKSDVWLVDPLDGTTNFVSGLPDFTISIAYLQASKPVLGVIYNPPMDELFYAEVDRGAFLNDGSIHVSPESSLLDSLLATGFPYDLDQIDFDPFRAWVEIFYKSRGIRHIASAALTMAYVAAGRLGAYWEEGCFPWDLAAGMLLVSEAGGISTRIDGGPDPLELPCSILASNGKLHPELIQLLGETDLPLA